MARFQSTADEAREHEFLGIGHVVNPGDVVEVEDHRVTDEDGEEFTLVGLVRVPDDTPLTEYAAADTPVPEVTTAGGRSNRRRNQE